MLRFAVLGAAEVHDTGHPAPLEIGGPVPRRLLTMLVAADGRPIPDDRLAAAMWTGGAPSDPAGALQVYVSRLRRALPGAEIARTAHGYRLAVAPEQTDVGVFTARVTAGTRTDLREALGLWRGEPFADVTGDDGIEAARAGLHELRETALEESAAGLLADGGHAAAVAELEELVRAAPYRERRWALLALALYRGGRQADALGAIRRVRALLTGELGVEPGPELREVERRILAHDPVLLEPVAAGRATGPPTTTAGAVPRTLSAFIGREDELALLDRLTTSYPLVTVVGAAGAGKTRLAMQHAGTAVFIRLADAADPSALLPTIAAALGVPDTADDPGEAIAAALRFHTGTPLVLDNCEHLTDGLAALVWTLLERVPALRIIATSRTPLGVDGERILPLGPMPAPDAVALLADRIRAARPDWTPAAADHEDLSRLAGALDGLPLALELAAARARTIGLRELTARLGDLTLLGRVPHGAVTPHRTLQEAIAWSFGLLSPAERDLVVRLWPYEGGFDADAAGDLDALAALVDQSVVTADADTGRFRLLETIRAYCRSVDPDPADSRETHAAWVRAMVASKSADLVGDRGPAAMRVLRRELPNIRAALAHDLTHAPEQALRAAAGLMWFWIRAGLLTEGRRVLGDALAAAPGAPVADRIRARAAYTGLEGIIGDRALALEMLADAARELDGSAEQDALRGEVRYYQALLQLPDGDAHLALAAATEALEIAQTTRIPWLIPSAEMALGGALVLAGDLRGGRERLRAAIAHGPTVGQTWAAGLSELMLAQTMITERDGDPLPLLRSSARRFRDEDDLSDLLAVLHQGAVALDGDPRSATLRAVVHHHLARHAISPVRSYFTTVVPDGWYTGDPPPDPPSLDDAFAALGDD
ncbi:BTAD domain-containing putative transcriptional regulator [Catenuloplanes sp. NPDC051500]|uniref:AfsR/SARP family transcriptional regulator n=1 Tax=Catenuloplanes sp. NPDC051500 TaxID=3363959 RepID=UPI0037B2C2FD